MDNKIPPDQKAGFLHVAGIILLGFFILVSVITWVAQYADDQSNPVATISNHE